MKSSFFRITFITFLVLVFSFDNAFGQKRYSGSKHSSSHGGHYSSGRGSSHKGGHYKNPKTNNHYGKHKK
ncbi:MAG: hypothetical protein V4450_04180 [Bacteroidota bacterium]